MPLRKTHSQSVSRHDSAPALSATLWPGPTLVASVSTLLLLCFCWGLSEPVASADTAARTLVLSVERDRVSATIAQAPLREVLAELARQVPLRVSMTGPVAEERVSVSFKNLPLAEGIERILAGRSYALMYASPQAASGVAGRARIVEIMLLPREGLPANATPAVPFATERAPAPVEAVSPPSPAGAAPPVPEEPPVEWLRDQIREASTPAERVAALEALTERSESQDVLPTLTAALADPDATVRAAALALIKDTGEAIPLAPVTQLAAADASPELRMQALALLALAGFVGSAYAMELESWDKKFTNASARFKVLNAFNNEAVLDKETGLVWEKSPGDTDGDTDVDINDRRTWTFALRHCANKDVGGRRGWRLPSFAELASLLDPNNPSGNPDLPPGHPFIAVQSSLYWSATALADFPTSAWRVLFDINEVENDVKTDPGFVWCVRGPMNADQY